MLAVKCADNWMQAYIRIVFETELEQKQFKVDLKRLLLMVTVN